MPTSREIRRQFIDFFVKRCGHTHAPSSPVVPHDDPTLLFTNAGMNQFKDVFLGVGRRDYSRAVNSQKCIRAGGKHNDLDDVGRDTYHHTFFEMLGNWSFGDYFKREAIRWAWQLLTEVWGLEKDRLYATVFAGDPTHGLEPDTEAERLWTEETDIDPGHISRWPAADNFWEMGESGPCGPCSEIHVDLTPDKSGAGLVNRGDNRVVELWNLVFIQFNRAPGSAGTPGSGGSGGQPGKLTPLPANHVDTGMGFERLCAVLQGKVSNYDTDVFEPIFRAIAKITGAGPYGGSLESSVDMAYRVIADHARCLTFALTDGALPSNEGRGYVLRRILRRAVRYSRQHLNATRPFLHELTPVIVEQMGDVFPELKKDPKGVAEIIKEEEESFGQTLDRGIELFTAYAGDAFFRQFVAEQITRPKEEMITIGVANDRLHTRWLLDELDKETQIPVTIPVEWDSRFIFVEKGRKKESLTRHFADLDAKFVREMVQSPPVIAGEKAFKLYDTFGFPLDLTQIMAEERGMSVDTEGFEKLMAEQRQLSRAESAQGDPARQSLLRFVQGAKLPATQFIGYDEVVAESVRCVEVLVRTNESYEPADTLSVGQAAAVVTQTTPFYAEAGGQVGDSGTIHSARGAVFRVDDTIRVGEVFFHLGQLDEGNVRRGEPAFSEDDPLLLEIDQPRRRRIRAHHTVTHLLNWALRKVLGEHVQQRGSLLDEHKTRFDFSHSGALTPEQIQKVQELVNERIEDDLTVYAEVVPQEKALEIHGLRAVFGEKYPPMVRVVSIGVPIDQLLKKPGHKDWQAYSIEFCGGTHLRSTAEAQRFVITGEEAVARGVRRLTAIAGEAAERAIAHAEMLGERLEALTEDDPESLAQDLASCIETMDAASLPLAARDRLRDKLEGLQQIIRSHRRQKQQETEESVVERARRLADEAQGPLIIAPIEGADAQTLRKAMDVIRSKRPEAAMLLAAAGGDRVALLAAVPKDLIEKGLKAGDWVRDAARVTGGGGGGRPDMAQAGGKNPARLHEALEAARAYAERIIGQNV